MPPTQSFSLDGVFFRRFFRLLRLMYPGWCSASVWLSIFVLLIGILEQVVAYYLGLVPSEFYVALGSRNYSNFRYLCGKATLLVIAKALSIAASMYSSSLLYLEIRRVLCFLLHSQYFKGLAFYLLNSPCSDIDNPDQRMTQDAEKTARVFATQIFSNMILAPFLISFYTYKTYASSGYLGPVAIFLYFVVGTIINKLLLSPIVNLVVKQERKEGDFRFKHVAVRSHAESIGFYHSSTVENVLTNRNLSSLLAVQTNLVNRQFFLNFSTQTFDYFGSILSYMIIAIAVFALHSYDHVTPVELTGIVSQNSFFYMYLIFQFSSLISLSGKIGDLAGTTHRVVELLEEMEALNEGKKSSDSDTKNEVSDQLINSETDSSETAAVIVNQGLESTKTGDHQLEYGTDLTDLAYSLNSVSFSAPGEDKKVIVRDLTATLAKGRNLLITGDSGSGKTSLLRILTGVWQINSGSIQFHWSFAPGEVLFIPQKSYFSTGDTLRQQIIYPQKVPLKRKSKKDGDVESQMQNDNERIAGILKRVYLEDLIERCDGLDEPVEWDWIETLSPGELQRLSMARVLYHRPKIVFLDEATSAIGFEMEEQLYGEILAEGITCVSVGHRLSLKQFHEFELHLDGRGGWKFREIPASSRTSQITEDRLAL